METRSKASAVKGPSPKQRILVGVVADDEDDRALISEAFAADRVLRVASSCPLTSAETVIDRHHVDVIVGFADSDRAWRRFKSLASRFPETLSVLLVSDPERVHAKADGQVLNAVVSMAREELPSKAAAVAVETAREFGIEGIPLADANAPEREKLAELSERELEVLVLTAHGLAIKEIAYKLARSYATVATHRVNIMDKLDLHDRVALTRFAIRHELIDA